MNRHKGWAASSAGYRGPALLDNVIGTERDTLIFRLLAVGIAAATLRFLHEDVTEISVAPAASVAVAYLVYTLLLGRVIIRRLAPRLSLGLSLIQLVFAMILVDAAALSALLYLVGGPESMALIIPPLFIIYHSIYLGYLSCLFSATLFSLFFVSFAYVWDEADFVTDFVAYLVPFFYLLAVFGGYLGERRLRDRWEKEELQQLVREGRRARETPVSGEDTGSGTDVDFILRTVIADSCRLTGLSMCLVTVLDEEGEKLVGRAGNVDPAELRLSSLDRLVFDADENPATSTALQTWKPVIVTEAVMHAHRLPAWARRLGVEVLVAIPLVALGRIWGVMYLFDTSTGRSIDRERASLAERYAKLAAEAIANAWLRRPSP